MLTSEYHDIKDILDNLLPESQQPTPAECAQARHLLEQCDARAVDALEAAEDIIDSIQMSIRALPPSAHNECMSLCRTSSRVKNVKYDLEQQQDLVHSLSQVMETLVDDGSDDETEDEEAEEDFTDLLQSMATMSVTTQHADNGEKCCICFAQYEVDETLHQLPCEHCFHTDCITGWLGTGKNTCPVCRQLLI